VLQDSAQNGRHLGAIIGGHKVCEVVAALPGWRENLPVRRAAELLPLYFLTAATRKSFAQLSWMKKSQQQLKSCSNVYRKVRKAERRFPTFSERTVEPSLSSLARKVPAGSFTPASSLGTFVSQFQETPPRVRRPTRRQLICFTPRNTFRTILSWQLNITPRAEHLVPAAHNLVLISLARLLLPDALVRKLECMGSNDRGKSPD
jgi:hypothetical protein